MENWDARSDCVRAQHNRWSALTREFLYVRLLANQAACQTAALKR